MPTANTVLTGADRHSLHSDTELVQRWLRSQRPAKWRGTFLFAKVEQQFCVGSTSAYDICRRHGFDPEMKVLRQ